MRQTKWHGRGEGDKARALIWEDARGISEAAVPQIVEDAECSPYDRFGCDLVCSSDPWGEVVISGVPEHARYHRKRIRVEDALRRVKRLACSRDWGSIDLPAQPIGERELVCYLPCVLGKQRVVIHAYGKRIARRQKGRVYGPCSQQWERGGEKRISIIGLGRRG